ncbi:MAG: RnfABCDGE type electron transport complex subunit D [Candidatus Cloacimonetes bacterium]|nr:RnfABCDGE type electron transport complex subunit D [Candidatus Cloacimonadota bacterium]
MKSLFMAQKNMQRMLYALIPVLLFGIFLFGWRVLLVLVITNLTAVITEFLFVRNKKNGKISLAVLVTGSLLALSLPPTIPFWMASVGAVVAISFGKMVFGGFGMNVFNPAIVGRTFMYISFANMMTVNWIEPFKSLPGGFAAYLKVENLTSATPLITFRDTNVHSDLIDLLLGFIPGSIGETSALLILLTAIYLVVSKTARWQPIIATLASFAIFASIFRTENPLPFLFSGSIMFGAVYMTTDPVSMPKDKRTIWIYGLLIGAITALIRKYSLFVEGFSFALLIANTFTPIIDYGFSKVKKKGA